VTEPWWTGAVVYQVYPRSFADSNGDGIGDLIGIMERLPYLRDLGIDAIWLSPVYQSPHHDNGYDVSDYQDIDPAFGSLADFDMLLEAVHAQGMKLVMDLVVNHTSDEHPWFIDSRSNTQSPRRDWYWWRPARPGTRPGDAGAEPNNWASRFLGPAWTLDPQTGEYYLHIFSARQPDLNWENHELRQAIYSMMNWWLDREVDGFRMDVINFISKDPLLPDGEAVEPGGYGDGRPYYICGPRIHEFLHEMHQEVFAPRPDRLLTVGEMPDVTVDEARLFTDPRRREIDMVFQFEHVQLDRGSTKWDLRPLNLIDLKASMGRWQTGLADIGWNSLYWSNHDQPRPVSRYGDDRDYRELSAKMLATILHLHRGTPFIYQGDELGTTNSQFQSIDDFRDIETLNHYAEAIKVRSAAAVLVELRAASRDNARTPMQWDDSPNAGFSSRRPWIRPNPNYREVNAAQQIRDPHSVFHYYRRLIALRHQEPAVARGSFEMLWPDDEQIYAFIRKLDSVELLVLGNFSTLDVAVEDQYLAKWVGAEMLIGNYPEQPTWPLVLRPWQAAVFRRTE
jgi:oligo-1,6-glucosidase